jgi:O-antigen/teichoic acid export membrane protein
MSFVYFSQIFKRAQNDGDERYRRAALTSLMNLLSQVLNITTGLVSVPLALEYVGPERFGMWMTLSAALMFISFSDFGVGLGVQDRVSTYHSQGNNDRARSIFFSGILFVLFLLGLLVGLGEALVPMIDLSSILGLKSEVAIADVDPTVRILIFVIGIGLVAGVIHRGYAALQDGFWVALIYAFSRALSLALLFVVVKFEMGLPVLVFVVGGLAHLILIIFGLPLLLFRHRWLSPISPNFREIFFQGHFGEILKVGRLGLGASIAIYLVNNTPLLLMSAKYGAQSIVDYAIVLKLVGIPNTFVIYILAPLWPAITDANARGDIVWIRKLYTRFFRLIIIISFASAVGLVFFGKWLILKWTGTVGLILDNTLILACTAFMVIGFWNALNSTLLNGMSAFRGQATYGLVLAVLFSLLAAGIPNSFPKEYVILVVAVGYFLRCFIMQLEVRKRLIPG